MLAATFLLAACSADEPSAPEPIDSDFEGIVLNISNPTASTTRANELASLIGNEGKVSSLTVIAFPESGDPIIREIANPPALTHEYKQVPVRIPAEKYKIYVMANVNTGNLYFKNESASSSSDLESFLSAKISSEDDLKYLNLNLSPTAGFTNGIPMTCHHNTITASSTENGRIVIEPKQTTTVYATLIFAVAKVNYTVYNGKLGMLKMDLDNEPVQVLNYETRVGLIDHINDTHYPKEGIDIDGSFKTTPVDVSANGTFYICDNTDYVETTGPDEADYTGWAEKAKEAGKDNYEIADHEKTDAWVYQGVAYVPENLFQDKEKVEAANLKDKDKTPTQITFTFKAADSMKDELGNLPSVANYTNKYFTFGGEDEIDNPLNPNHPNTVGGEQTAGSSTHHGVVRGVIYDVLIYTTRKDITLQVRVRPWAYAKYTWTL